jgi:hypothetical protein|tara:strand:+ start:102 stop:506 length:405 start_codon:yes stop_codon:yes gene_type:complete
LEEEIKLKHNSDFKYDLATGKKGEGIIGTILEGDKVEVKSEIDKWIKSGNHYCEYRSRGKDSGILKTQSQYWTINFYKGKDFCFAISLETDKLKMMIKNNNYRSAPGGDSNTSWGWLVPIKDLMDVNNYNYANT